MLVKKRSEYRELANFEKISPGCFGQNDFEYREKPLQIELFFAFSQNEVFDARNGINAFNIQLCSTKGVLKIVQNDLDRRNQAISSGGLGF